MTERMVMGMDIGGTAVKYVVGGAGDPDRYSGEVSTDPGDIDATFTRLAERITSELSGLAPCAAGIACAGIVDPVEGHLGRAPNLPGWQGANLAAALRRGFGEIPSVFANDVNAALVGEARVGAGRGCRNLVMLALGTGVGGAVMIDGRLVIGTHNGAGEIGHMVLDPGGPPCGCGNNGCLEAFAGSRGVLAEARRRALLPDTSSGFNELIDTRGDDLTTRDLANLAEAGDVSAGKLFRDTGMILGIAVGNLINVLDPEKVIIGGGVALAGALILDPCRATASSLILCEASRAIPIEPADLGPKAAALGVADLARDVLEAM